jgi:hypothetical protein
MTKLHFGCCRAGCVDAYLSPGVCFSHFKFWTSLLIFTELGIEVVPLETTFSYVKNKHENA